MSKKLYVGNLSFQATDEELRETFSQYGNVDTVNLITDRDTGRSKGFAFIEMSNADEAQECITALDTKEFLGRNLRVNVATDRKERPSTNRW